MTNQKKRYYDENGNPFMFDLAKFKKIFDSNARAKQLKKEDYLKELAEAISCSPDTILGWKKGKNAPQDRELVHSLENALGLSNYSLMYSKEKQLENELKKEKNINSSLILENTDLKEKIKREEKYRFIDDDDFDLRYDGFSNLIDILIGKCIENYMIDDPASTYAEELSYILSDYIYNYSLAELSGFGGKRSREEIKTYISEHKGEDDDQLFRWINEAITDSKGNKLYDQNGKITLKGLDLFERLKNGIIFNDSDSSRLKALIDEMINTWNNISFPYATIEVKIIFDDNVLNRYTYGDGWTNPTNDNRLDIITELLFLVNGDISRFSLKNVKKFKANKFEYKIYIEYDIKDLI